MEEPDYQSVGRRLPIHIIQGQKLEREVSRDRCLSPRRSASNTIWTAMRTTVHGARSACDAEGPRTDMSEASEMTMYFNKEMKMNLKTSR